MASVDEAELRSRHMTRAERGVLAPHVASRFADPRSLASLALAFTLLALALSRSGIDAHKTLAAMKAARFWLVALGFVVFYVSIPLRSWRWRILMLNASDGAEREAIRACPWRDTTEIFYLSWFANCLVPAKLGDLYRGYLARKSMGVSGSQTVGTVVAERLLDLLVLLPLLIVSTLVAFHHHIGHLTASMSTVFVFGGLLTGSAAAVLIGLWRFHTVLIRLLPPHLAHYFSRFRDGAVQGLRGNVVGPLLLTVAAWCLEGARLLCVLAALGLFHLGDLGVAAALFLALGASVLTTLPLTPGGLAFVETFLIVGMTVLGIQDRSLAASVTVLDRAISFLSLIVIGFLVYILSAKTHHEEVLAPLSRLPLWRRRVNRRMAEHRAPNETHEAREAEARTVSTSPAQDLGATTADRLGASTADRGTPARSPKRADRWLALEEVSVPEVHSVVPPPLPPRPAQTPPVPVGGLASTAETASGPALRLLNLTTIELVVSPFHSFQQVGRFQQMLSSIPTVQAVRPRRLQQGILQFRVECQRSTDLLSTLSEVCTPSFPFRVLSHEAHRIELVFEDEIDRDQEVTYA